MKRRVINEFNRSIYAIDIMLYTIIAVVGYLLLNGFVENVVGVNQFSLYLVFSLYLHIS